VREPAVAFLKVLQRHRIGPLPVEDLNEPFGLAVGSGRVGPGADVPQTQRAAGLGKRFGDLPLCQRTTC